MIYMVIFCLIFFIVKFFDIRNSSLINKFINRKFGKWILLKRNSFYYMTLTILNIVLLNVIRAFSPIKDNSVFYIIITILIVIMFIILFISIILYRYLEEFKNE